VKRWSTGDSESVTLAGGSYLSYNYIVVRNPAVTGDIVEQYSVQSSRGTSTLSSLTEGSLLVAAFTAFHNASMTNDTSAETGWTQAADHLWTYVGTYRLMSSSVYKSTLEAGGGSDNYSFYDSSPSFGWQYGGRASIVEIAPQVLGGEKDYTITFSNVPTLIEPKILDFEVKTTLNTLAFAGATVNWNGFKPVFNRIGTYRLRLWAGNGGLEMGYISGPEDPHAAARFGMNLVFGG